MAIVVQITGDGLRRFGRQVKDLHTKFPTVLPRIINQVGDRSKTQVIRSLVKQTGLERKVVVHAVGDPLRAHVGNLSYTLSTRGKPIRYKYFAPREMRKGVVAKPFGMRTTFPKFFMRAGWWKTGRIDMPQWNGHVKGSSGFGQRKSGGMGVRIYTPKSDVVIPEEMVKGATKVAFESTAAPLLQTRVEAAIKKLLK